MAGATDIDVEAHMWMCAGEDELAVSDDGFSLVTQPWIPVQLGDGRSAEVSLRDAFRRAHEIREIRGELPTQSFAILRLMLAILYRVRGGERLTTARWEEWSRSGLPVQLINGYLDTYAARLDLFDAERPFYQVANLVTASGESKGVAQLILDLPSNNRLFTNRSGSGAKDLSFAEAARWLVNAQAWDASGIKSGALGDGRVKRGKGYPIGVAWSGLLGAVFAQGTTLKDTLLLNLVAPGYGIDADTEADVPPWEDDLPDTPAEREGLLPNGPVRLYTWQSRRIRLYREDDRVVGCLVANGDKLTPQNKYTYEPMSAWRYSDPQTKVAKHTVYMPREHQAGRALWRGIGALLPGVSPLGPKAGVASGLIPGVVEWIARDAVGELAAGSLMRLRSIGVVYGSNNSVVDEVLHDEVAIPLALLSASNRALALQAEEAVRLADEGVMHLRRLAENLERAAGGAGEGSRARAGDLAYAALDGPYRAWLAGLQGDEDPLDAIAGWKRSAHSVLMRLGREAVTGASPAAWAGREVTRGGRTDLITTPRAEGWFLRALNKTFGPFTAKAIAGSARPDGEGEPA
ncbi:type I-E CRISPR-associated protein Cse1/CasA [Microbacterium sp. BWT-B31]|uniref:type I-E CRISPR-associated protein Cse1/CasA n=1 Tax=Microbacterium sp. BWT-B31 TaxID=3232072 RepID=UPI003526EBC1